MHKLIHLPKARRTVERGAWVVNCKEGVWIAWHWPPNRWRIDLRASLVSYRRNNAGTLPSACQIVAMPVACNLASDGVGIASSCCVVAEQMEGEGTVR